MDNRYELPTTYLQEKLGKELNNTVDMAIEIIAEYFDEMADKDKNEWLPPRSVAKLIRNFKERGAK